MFFNWAFSRCLISKSTGYLRKAGTKCSFTAILVNCLYLLNEFIRLRKKEKWCSFRLQTILYVICLPAHLVPVNFPASGDIGIQSGVTTWEKIFLNPLKIILPSSLSLILTFIICGFIHDSVIMLLRWQFTLIFTPWFLLMGIWVIVSDLIAMDYSKLRWINCALI